MTTLRFFSFPALLVIASAVACGGDDTSGGGSGDSTGGTTGAATDATDPTNGQTDDSPSAGSTGAASTTADSADSSGDASDATEGSDDATDTAGDCQSWLVTYDLTGSVFQIDSTQSFTITLEEPYDEPLNMGPGTITLRLPDDNGAPGAGPAMIVEYALTQDFITGAVGTDVHTVLNNTAGPEACGVATGALGADLLPWAPAEIAPYCQDGMVSCMGGFCGMFGAPPADMPIIYEDDCTTTLPLNPFTFTDGVDAFTMPPVSVDKQATLALVGTMTEMVLDEATPECACAG